MIDELLTEIEDSETPDSNDTEGPVVPDLSVFWYQVSYDWGWPYWLYFLLILINFISKPKACSTIFDKKKYTFRRTQMLIFDSEIISLTIHLEAFNFNFTILY